MKFLRFLLSGCALIILFTDFTQAQFIANKSRPLESYINFSGRNYENYSSQFIRKKFFDNFGNFLIEGTTLYELSEVQRQQTAGDALLGGTSDIIKSRFYQNYFTNLIIGSDSYGGFQTRLMIGDAIRTKFTSLTFDKARFNGIRWDAGTPKYRGTIVASRISDPVRFSFETSIFDQGRRRIRDWTQYLFGGHFETDIGDMLTIGVTYVNQHQRRSSIDSKEASIEGVVAAAIPRIIFLRISDNSPDDGSGPIIYSPPTIIINGIARPIKNIHNDMPSDQSTSLNQPIQYWVVRNNIRQQGFTINDKDYFAGTDTTSFTRLINYKNRYSVLPPNYPFQVPSRSTESLTYAFLMPEGTESVQFNLLLSNDYKVETAQDHVNYLDEYSTGARFIPHATDGVIGWPTPFFTRATARGNVKDASNKQVVVVNYGLTSGMSVYGMHFKFKWEGLELEGEFNESVEFMKYPLLAGNRFKSKGKAWFLRGKKQFGRYTFGGERYHISPDYVTWLNTYVLENSYFSRFTSQSFIPIPVAPDFTGYDPTHTAQDDRTIFPGGVFFALVDDNDDNDRWEDGFYHYGVRPSDPGQRNVDILNGGVGDYFKLGYRLNQNELASLTDIIRRPDAGLFPGRDNDGDGIPDDDRNADGIPDYTQDFLTYFSDPPSFNYGDDWNNNGVIDEQEIDILPDYPYEPDIDGYHIFQSLDLLDNLNFRIGKINEEALARGGKNDVNYFRVNYFTSTPRFGSFRIFYVMKQVQDNIRNNGYQFKGAIRATNPIPEFVVDPLNYRNSMVNSVYIGTKYTQISNLNIENNVRIEVNNQFALGNRLDAFTNPDKVFGSQIPGVITFYGIVNKIDYTFSIFNGALKFSPQVKIRTEKIVKSSEDLEGNPKIEIQEHLQEVIPIFRIDYRLTENTDLRFGVQGFNIFGLTGNTFDYKVRNFKDGIDSRNVRTIAVSLSNRSSYSGYTVVFDFGIKHTNIEYIRPQDKTKGAAESVIFFSVFAGF